MEQSELLCDDECLVLNGDKYSLRPRSVRRGRRYDDEDLHSPGPSRRSKSKQKPAPLSKYRRKTANARERSRMREINAAFETLRRAIPQLQNSKAISNTNEKLTKITTLRLAMKYITVLTSTLNSSESSNEELTDLISDYSDLDLLLESDGESLNMQSDASENSITPDILVECLTPVDLTADFADHFADQSLSPTFTDHTFSPFDSLFPDFS